MGDGEYRRQEPEGGVLQLLTKSIDQHLLETTQTFELYQ
jgi:hypothetical protein